MHVQNTLTDTIGLLSPSSWPLDDALKKISKSKQGALVFITNVMSESDTSNIELIQQKKSNNATNKCLHEQRQQSTGFCL